MGEEKLLEARADAKMYRKDAEKAGLQYEKMQSAASLRQLRTSMKNAAGQKLGTTAVRRKDDLGDSGYLAHLANKASKAAAWFSSYQAQEESNAAKKQKLKSDNSLLAALVPSQSRSIGGMSHDDLGEAADPSYNAASSMPDSDWEDDASEESEIEREEHALD